MTHASLPCTLMVLCVALSFHAQAATHGSHAHAPRKTTSVSFHQAPSEESAAARDKRLERECRGRPNAGMCLGHTR